MLRSGAYSDVEARDAFRSFEAVIVVEDVNVRRLEVCASVDGGGVQRRSFMGQVSQRQILTRNGRRS